MRAACRGCVGDYRVVHWMRECVLPVNDVFP
jgi:hypothetical protein